MTAELPERCPMIDDAKLAGIEARHANGDADSADIDVLIEEVKRLRSSSPRWHDRPTGPGEERFVLVDEEDGAIDDEMYLKREWAHHAADSIVKTGGRKHRVERILFWLLPADTEAGT